MVAEDDGRSTIEISDRYAILPALDEALYMSWLDAGASQVEDGFYYASDRNPEHLGARGLQDMLTAAFPDHNQAELPEKPESQLNKSA